MGRRTTHYGGSSRRTAPRWTLEKGKWLTAILTVIKKVGLIDKTVDRSQKTKGRKADKLRKRLMTKDFNDGRGNASRDDHDVRRFGPGQQGVERSLQGWPRYVLDCEGPAP